ncbi:hypothetical protein RJ640_003422 [Escallonia rubra]|uniref:5'-3' exonuclease domain-containing protein n=1 Tax=Escallonia rubra TaxID=112253 RepID=A0AA88UJZ8_9ASTE|nr:hypothetical protein RJ640_003422 [Escallonia rubra]
MAASAYVHLQPHLSITSPHPPLSRSSTEPTRTRTRISTKAYKLRASNIPSSSSCSSSLSRSKDRTVGGPLLPKKGDNISRTGSSEENICKAKKRRVFFLDVNPLCYNGSTPSLHSFAHWIGLFFSQVSGSDPIIAVIDGEGGNEYRRQLLPSYKAHRRKFTRQFSAPHRSIRSPGGRSHEGVSHFLRKCNVTVLKMEGHEADDVVATLVGQVLQMGHRVVIASPDKDFKQLITENVQIVMPMPEFDRWSFYTLKHYIAQYSCDPGSDLSLRCIMGDEVDGVPGIQHVVPGFGRKTALKLIKKYGSLDNLLDAAAVRTVGRQYAQDALTKYADYLRRNYEVLSLRRDLDVLLQEEWLSERDPCNDSVVLSNFVKLLGETCDLSKNRY